MLAGARTQAIQLQGVEFCHRTSVLVVSSSPQLRPVVYGETGMTKACTARLRSGQGAEACASGDLSPLANKAEHALALSHELAGSHVLRTRQSLTSSHGRAGESGRGKATTVGIHASTLVGHTCAMKVKQYAGKDVYKGTFLPLLRVYRQNQDVEKLTRGKLVTLLYRDVVSFHVTDSVPARRTQQVYEKSPHLCCQTIG